MILADIVKHGRRWTRHSASAKPTIKCQKYPSTLSIFTLKLVLGLLNFLCLALWYPNAHVARWTHNKKRSFRPAGKMFTVRQTQTGALLMKRQPPLDMMVHIMGLRAGQVIANTCLSFKGESTCLRSLQSLATNQQHLHYGDESNISKLCPVPTGDMSGPGTR